MCGMKLGLRNVAVLLILCVCMCVCVNSHVVGICCNIAVCCKVSWLLLALGDVMVTQPIGGVSFLFKCVPLGNKDNNMLYGLYSSVTTH